MNTNIIVSMQAVIFAVLFFAIIRHIPEKAIPVKLSAPKNTG